MYDKSDMFATLGPQAQQEPMGIRQRCARNALSGGRQRPVWLRASIVAVAVFGVSEQLLCWPQSGWAFLQNSLALTEYGLARLSSSLIVRARSVKITSLAQSLQQAKRSRRHGTALGGKPRRSRRQPSALVEARV